MKTPKPTKDFEKTLAVYRHFAKVSGITENPGDMQKQFIFESLGRKKYQEIYGEIFDAESNFFAVGKKWKEWQITNWLEDLHPANPFLFAAADLYTDYKDFPEMLELLDSAIYPQLSRFQQLMVDDAKNAIQRANKAV